MHLLLPLIASVFSVLSLICFKRSNSSSPGDTGINSLTQIFVLNQSAAFVFSFMWFFGEGVPSMALLWQPMLVAITTMTGMGLMILAISYGDVSIATPLMGSRVVLVALLLIFTGVEELNTSTLLATLLATIGIALVQSTGRSTGDRIANDRAGRTIVLALAASVCYAIADVIFQNYSPAWGATRIIPLTYWMIGLLSWPLIPWVEWSKLRQWKTVRWLVLGIALMLTNMCLFDLAIACFGDAARVNTVFALRGLWGVILAWVIAKRWGGAEAKLSPSLLLRRLFGAAILTVAVVLAVAFQF